MRSDRERIDDAFATLSLTWLIECVTAKTCIHNHVPGACPYADLDGLTPSEGNDQ